MWETIMVKVKLQLTHTKSLQEFSFLDLDDALYLVFSIFYTIFIFMGFMCCCGCGLLSGPIDCHQGVVRRTAGRFELDLTG
jgi:hypothetical protein